MVNKETKYNSTAESFFGENKVAVPSESSLYNYREKLREQVLQKYLNYEQDTLMEEPLKTSVPFWKQKNFIKLAGVFTVVAVAAVAVVSLVSVNLVNRKPQTLKGEIAYTEGTVYFKTASSDWQKANKDTILEQGSSLKVEGAGKAIANLDDGSSIRLNENTAVTLTSMDADHIVINNDQGEVYSRVAKAERTFDVIANGITYRSMGTAYKTLCYDKDVEGEPVEKVNPDEVVINGVEVYESKVQILGSTDNNIIVQQGEKYFVVDLEQPELANKVTEVTLEQLQNDEFVMWNKAEDEKVQEFKNQMGVLFDVKIPDLTVTSPTTEDSTVNTATVNVSGVTEANTKITVNDVAITNNNGSFDYVFNLVDGYNGIKLIVEDNSGNKAVRNFRVNYVNPNAEVTTTVAPSKTTAPTAKAGITLSGTKVSNGVSFTWNVTGLDVSKGFKLVKSTSDNPVYPGNDYQYLTNGSQRSYTWTIKDGVTYKFRICQYNGNGACLVYSNQITVQAPLVTVAPTNPAAANLVLSVSGSNKVSWTVGSGVSDSGFKVVWSKTSGPTYPTRGTDQYQYFGDANRRTSDALSDFDGYGTYYVRVCAYNNGPSGECTPYSNQVTLTLGTAPTSTPTVTP